MLKGYDGMERGVIVHCYSCMKFKILFMRAKLFFIFSVNSVRGIGKNFENEK